MAPYTLYLDDLRENPNPNWIVARSLNEAETIVKSKGMPDFISFDHDLGEEATCPNGLQVAKMLVNLAENGYPFPENFDFQVHSANPVGKLNIESYLLTYFRING